MIVGALGVVGGLASLAGPVGAVLSSILSVFSMLFGLFAEEKKAEESQESMLKRVINEALKNARAEELKADAEGLKKVMLSIRNSINQFRESGVTKEQATEMYTQIFTGLKFFGQLKYEINKFCDCSVDVNKFDDKKRDEKIKDSEKCLQFLNLYSDLSIYRLLLIADMASLFNSIEDPEGVGLDKTILLLSEKERASDAEILAFLFDPINNIRQRFCISLYHGAPNKYPTIMAYTDVLKKKEMKSSKDVTICSEKELLGVCHNLNVTEKKEYKTIEDLHGWGDKIKSIYVPEHLTVSGFSRAYFKEPNFGWYTGPTVIGTVPHNRDGKWNSFKVDPTPTLAHQMIRLCLKQNFEQNGFCHQLEPYTNAGHSANLRLISVETFEKKVESVMIPEGLQAEFFSEINQGGTKYGPFYGPNSIDNFCIKDKVVSIRILYSQKEVSQMVKICKGESFSHQCEYLDKGAYPSLTINGCDYTNKDEKIKSMIVPAGLKVLMWTEKNCQGMDLGPYVGPLSLSAIEGVGSKLKVMSLIVKDTEDTSVTECKAV
ncbi:uncharacterized protein LOC105849946 isoform X2 [Hydra vulgaris]|nr:uncharacterized protein LOC105849946 isoform X2 [Hydra vulgaris]